MTQSRVYQGGISVSAYVLGKAWYHSVASNDLYIFLCGNGMQPLYRRFCKPSFCNSARSKQKC